jgi:serine/threonine protein kinase
MKETGATDSPLLVSEYRDSIDVLLRARFLDPPSRPGLLACLDRFEVLRVVGVGGMGVVVLAREASSEKPPSTQTHSGPLPAEWVAAPPAKAPPVERASGLPGDVPAFERSRLVAIKMLKPELAASVRAAQQFVNEVRHMECLSHPHILPVLEVSEQNQRTQIRVSNEPGGQTTCPVLKARRPYYVMPYIEEGSLADLIRSKGPLPEASVASVASQMASALAYVHDKGITHRDLNPANILIDAQGRAYLTDFGLSRTVFNDPLTDARREQRVGTTPYMSPAVAMGEAEDTRCDIYAFGAVLYQMLTGQAPYTGPDANSVIQQIVSGPPRPILSINPGAPRRLAQIAEGAMGRNLRERYARMADIVSDLERVNGGKKPLGPRSQHTGAGHGSWKERLSFPGRKPVLIVSAILALSALILYVRHMTRPALEVVQTIRAPGIYRWDNVRLGDWDGNKHQDLFLIDKGELVIVNELGVLLRAPPIGGGVRHMALDLVVENSHDHTDEALVSWSGASGAVIGVFGSDFAKILAPSKQFFVDKPASDGGAQINCSLIARKVLDLNGDGKKQLLAVLASESPQKTARLFCFDYDSTLVLWSHPLGGADTGIECGDIDGDGRLEVLAGFQETGDKNSNGGVLALTSKGELLWKKICGEPGSQTTPFLADLNGDRKLAILAWTASARELSEEKQGASKVLRLDAGGNVVAEYSIDTQILSCMGAVLDGGKRAKILATDRDGCLHRLDHNLVLEEKRRIVSKQFDDVDLRILDVVDIGKNRHPYIVLSSAQCQSMPVVNARQRADLPNMTVYRHVGVHLADASLRTVASKELMEGSRERRRIGFHAVDWNGGGDPILVFGADEVWLLRFRNGEK